MEVKKLFFFVGFAYFFCSRVRCLRMSHENNVWEKDFTAARSDDGASDLESYDDFSTGPEKLPVEILELDENGLEEEQGKGKLLGAEVDEETIRKAEKMADKDLLNGLNRILKNNETLKDVFRAENVYEIP